MSGSRPPRARRSLAAAPSVGDPGRDDDN